MVRTSDAQTEFIPAPRRRRLPGSAILILAVLAVLVVAAVAWTGRTRSAEGSRDQAVAVATATIVKTDLSTTESLPGALGYGTARPIKGGKDGIVTWLPTVGSSIKRGAQLYRADDRPVPLFYGAMPLFRTLSEVNTVGRDVQIVAANLTALGYPIGAQPRTGQTVTQTTAGAAAPAPSASARPSAPATGTTRVTVGKGEDVLTRALIAALRSWQRDTGLPVTGRIEVGDVVVLTGAVRIDSLAGQLGDSADAVLMSVTPTAKVITVLAEATQAGTIDPGDKVAVALPNDQTVPGEVTAVGTALRGDTDDQNAPPKLTVTITVGDPNTVARLDSAQVQVDFVAETHSAVLAVPVGALLALREGGYAVQLAGGGLVAVETGIFAKGLVEISGAGLAVGTSVVTTS